MMILKSKLGASIVACLIACSALTAAHAQGPIVTGVGAVNRGMAGAGTAAPLDGIGALHWNPGSISALKSSEMSFGLELIDVDINLSSTFGGVTNTTNGDGGFAPIPSIGWVHHVDDSPFTVGLGIFAVAGFKNNMPFDSNNTLLNGTIGLGPAYADAEFLQIVPTVAYAVSDRLSIGVAPTVTTGKINLDPVGPSVVTPGAQPGSGNRMHWGGGFQIGAYYVANECWQFGFTYKSRQWFEAFNFFVPGGTIQWDLDYPMILSLGTAYNGLENWTIATDVRYVDFENADGTSDLGFSSVFAMAIGAEYHASDRWKLRFGYNFNSNPIHDDDAITNIITPLIQQHNVAVGGTVRLACNVDFNAAYVYLVENDVTGPLPAALGGPANTLTHEIEGHSGIIGMTVRY